MLRLLLPNAVLAVLPAGPAAASEALAKARNCLAWMALRLSRQPCYLAEIIELNRNRSSMHFNGRKISGYVFPEKI